jgi:hypothetical protein
MHLDFNAYIACTVVLIPIVVEGRIVTADSDTGGTNDPATSAPTGTGSDNGTAATAHDSVASGSNAGPEPIAPEKSEDPSQKEGSADKPSSLGPLVKIARFFRKGRTSTSGADQCLTYEQLKELRERIRARDDLTDEVAEELAAALRQAERIRYQDLYIPGVYDQLTFIFDCLLAQKPKLILARDARLNLQVEIYRQAGRISRTLAALSSGSSVGLVLSALVIAFILWTAIMFALLFISSRKCIPTGVFFMDTRAFAIITSAALIGGIVSIATRLNEFSRVRDLDPFAMFWTAMLKPLIGVVLAVFILATLEGNILSFGFLPSAWFVALSKAPQSDDAIKALYILWVFGFLAGFSERFALDFVGRAQSVASGNPGGDKNTPA